MQYGWRWLVSLVIPTGKDIRDLIRVEKKRLEIEEFIADMLGAQKRASFASITRNGITVKGDITMAELREGQQIVATVALKTKAGRPAAYQTGTAKWTSSADAVATVTPDPNNELSATIVGVDGSANTPVLVTFTADGDPDADQERDVVATLDIVVTQGEAFVAEITPGAATDVPAAPTT